MPDVIILKQSEADGETVLEWTAPEYERRPLSRRVLAGLGIAGCAILLVSFLAANYLFIALLLLAGGVFFLYSRREPAEIRFRLSRKGIATGSRFYPMTRFTSFWIFERREPRELSLATAIFFSPYLRLPLSDVDPKRIEALLSPFLPKQEHPEFLSDQIVRRLGF